MITAVNSAPNTPTDTATTSGGREMSSDAYTDTPQISGKNLGKKSATLRQYLRQSSGKVPARFRQGSGKAASPPATIPATRRSCSKHDNWNLDAAQSCTTSPLSPPGNVLIAGLAAFRQHHRQHSGKKSATIPATIPAMTPPLSATHLAARPLSRARGRKDRASDGRSEERRPAARSGL